MLLKDKKYFLSDFLDSGSLISLQNDKILLGYGERIWCEKSEENNFSIYSPDFFLSETKPWFFHKNWLLVEKKEWQQLFSSSPPPFSSIQLQWENPQKTVFFSILESLHKEFSIGLIKKAVPYLFASSTYNIYPESILAILHHMAKNSMNTPLYLYGWWDKHKGILGGTPEILFRYQKNPSNISTMACAGTIYAESDLIDEKLQKEHQYVVQGITNSLNSFGEIRCGPCKIKKFSSLYHLVTPIEVMNLRSNFNFEQIVQALHPTPALGVYPQHLGKKWLKEFDQRIPRERYGAPFAVNTPVQESICYVGIRNIQWNQNLVKLTAGCGIVPESNADDEWKELQQKMQSIKFFLGL